MPTKKTTSPDVEKVFGKADNAMLAAKMLRKCQTEFCKKQLAASDKLAKQVKTNTMQLLHRLSKKEISNDQFL